MIIAMLLNFLTSFILTYIVIPPVVRVSVAKKLFDEPNSRKLNKTVVPTLGGVAIFVGLTISSIIYLQQMSPGLRFLFAALVMMLFIGLKDDLLVISAIKKLAVQFAAALILVLLGNFRVTDLYGLASFTQIPAWASIVLSTVIILFLVNAFNLIDGIDGLAAGISLLISSVIGAWFLVTGHFNHAVFCFAMAGSLLAFLRFNIFGGKNKIFMGDTGSLIIGIFLAPMILKFIDLNLAATGPFRMEQAPLVALALLIVPVTDTLRVFTVRIWHKRSPFSPDMNHIHHLLIKSGMGHLQASSFLVVYTILFTALALGLQQHVNINFGFALLLGLSFSAVGFIYLNSRRTATRKLKLQPQRVVAKIIRLESWKDDGNGSEAGKTLARKV